MFVRRCCYCGVVVVVAGRGREGGHGDERKQSGEQAGSYYVSSRIRAPARNESEHELRCLSSRNIRSCARPLAINVEMLVPPGEFIFGSRGCTLARYSSSCFRRRVFLGQVAATLYVPPVQKEVALIGPPVYIHAIHIILVRCPCILLHVCIGTAAAAAGCVRRSRPCHLHARPPIFLYCMRNEMA